jgi:hypothetical protein
MIPKDRPLHLTNTKHAYVPTRFLSTTRHSWDKLYRRSLNSTDERGISFMPYLVLGITHGSHNDETWINHLIKANKVKCICINMIFWCTMLPKDIMDPMSENLQKSGISWFVTNNAHVLDSSSTNSQWFKLYLSYCPHRSTNYWINLWY